MKNVINTINEQLGEGYFVVYSKLTGFSKKVNISKEQEEDLKKMFCEEKTFFNQNGEKIDQMEEDDYLDKGECVVCVDSDSISFEKEEI